MARTRILAALAAAAVVLGAPVATWWAVGDLSETTRDPDYLMRPLDLPPGVEATLVVAALAFVVVGVAVLFRLVRTKQLDRRWLNPIALLATAGALTGFGWRVLTAGVVGANI